MSIEKFVEFVAAVESEIATNALHVDKCMDNLRLSLVWTTREMESGTPGHCDVLLKGCYGAAVEAVSLVSFGLVRPAILSLRSYFELSLQYTYYKDHPVEWRSVIEYRIQPILPATIKRYLRDNFSKFEKRFNKLSAVRTRSNEDCYHILSGVAHGAVVNSISSAVEPVELMEREEIVSQVVRIFHEVGEHVSDIYVAGYQSNWLSLPDGAKDDLSKRFGKNGPKKELEF